MLLHATHPACHGALFCLLTLPCMLAWVIAPCHCVDAKCVNVVVSVLTMCVMEHVRFGVLVETTTNVLCVTCVE